LTASYKSYTKAFEKRSGDEQTKDYSCQILMEIEFSLQIFEKNSKKHKIS